MLKNIACALFLLVVAAVPVVADPRTEEVSRLAQTQASIKNIATALEMWCTDNDKQYPSKLDNLLPLYLHRMPAPQEGVEKAKWIYLRSEDGKHFVLKIDGLRTDLKGAEMSYDSDQGFHQANIPADCKELTLQAPSGWSEASNTPFTNRFRSGENSVTASMMGPVGTGIIEREQARKNCQVRPITVAGLNGISIQEDGFVRYLISTPHQIWSLTYYPRNMKDYKASDSEQTLGWVRSTPKP